MSASGINSFNFSRFKPWYKPCGLNQLSTLVKIKKKIKLEKAPLGSKSPTLRALYSSQVEYLQGINGSYACVLSASQQAFYMPSPMHAITHTSYVPLLSFDY